MKKTGIVLLFVFTCNIVLAQTEHISFYKKSEVMISMRDGIKLHTIIFSPVDTKQPLPVMVGEGVLHECLLNEEVQEVLVIGRKPCGITHPKLKEIIHPDFYNLSPVSDKLVGYNACFFCLGVSSVGMKEPEYFQLTHTLTLHVAEILSFQNPGMTFCYISGAGTDSTEKGRLMWARVKGKTENDLAKLPFKKVYNFRPGILEPTKGLKNTLSFYKYFRWLAPVIRAVVPKQMSTLKELGLAMINAVSKGYEKSIVEVSDIKLLAKK